MSAIPTGTLESEIWLKGKEGALYNLMGRVYKLMVNDEEHNDDHFFCLHQITKQLTVWDNPDQLQKSV